ncbi:MAG: ABC transporter ATP-binding protein [Oliverpabstia sp.]
MSDIAISINDISKVYKLYDNPMDRLKESLGLTRQKKYKEHYALDHVSFQVHKGETVGIIGTNGAGKSTILKIITGVLSPTQGQVVVDGRISALLELGAGFNQEYSGIENVYLNGTMIGFTKEEIDAKLQDILDFADIGDFVYQPVKTYSSGMFVRLAFAVAINIEPEILIVDEALSVGDVFFQAKCYRKFEEFKQMGKTILFVSHDLSSIGKYCDRVVLLNQGKKLAEGDAKEMVNLYRRVMVNQYEDPSEEDDAASAESNQKVKESKEPMKNSLNLNPQLLEYGSKLAVIEDFAVRDNTGMITNIIEKGQDFSVDMVVRFYEDISDPIFAFTIKDLKGTEITGTNTMYENIPIQPQKKGDVRKIRFSQKMSLVDGEYMVCLGCTGYKDGNFTVFHRLYDVCSLTVISGKQSVGYYDMFAEVTVK